MTLTEFLLARLTDLEALARAVQDEKLSPSAPIDTGDDPWRSERAFAEHLTPARVLADVEAKRRIVEAARGPEPFGNRDADEGWTIAWASALTFLALPYANHPDYDESWRP